MPRYGGKQKYIESPEKLWELFEAYKKDVKNNPRIKIEYVGRNGERVETPIERPLIFEGFESYVCLHTRISYPDLSEYFEGTNESYSNYFPISARIKAEIRAEQVDGGMTNTYNASLTARVNGISDKKELDHKGGINIPNVPDIGERK